MLGCKQFTCVSKATAPDTFIVEIEIEGSFAFHKPVEVGWQPYFIVDNYVPQRYRPSNPYPDFCMRIRWINRFKKAAPFRKTPKL